MHLIEPHFNWLDLYVAAEDPRSPLYGQQYSEIEFQHTIYDHYIHPQWDSMESNTLYLKILYADYTKQFVIIELMGEWNDCLYNDIMFFKHNIIDPLILQGINKFILLGDNILNFHAAEDDYYQEWFDEIEDGYIVALNFRNHVRDEFYRIHADYYIGFGGELDDIYWRTLRPHHLFQRIESIMQKRLTL